MQILIESLPCDIQLPARVEPMLSLRPAVFLPALDRLREAVASSFSAFNQIERAAANLAGSLGLDELPDGVLLPKFLRDPSQGAEWSDRQVAATAFLSWALEARGVLLLMPASRGGRMVLGANKEIALGVQAMHEADPIRRVSLWRSRWELIEARGGEGWTSPSRQRTARFIAGDAPAAKIVSETDAAWWRQIQAACCGRRPLPLPACRAGG